MSRRTLPVAAAGVAATGAGAAVLAGAAARATVRRARRRPDPCADERFGELAGGSRSVVADDGVPLHVTEGGNPDAPVTVIFAHGWTLRQACWHYQWRALGEQARLVCYDQRGHGRSGTGRPESNTVDQVGRDAFAVIQAVAPDGPVVLVGHSMGGMTVMALADAHPELFGPVVTGVALLSTSAGGLADVSLGLPQVLAPLVQRVTPAVLQAARRRADALERRRKHGTASSYLLIRRTNFGPRASASLIDFTEQMSGGTPTGVTLDFLASLITHDKRAALAALAAVPVRIVVGDHDRLTPLAHSRALADALPGAHLEIVPDTGHMALLERPDVVNNELLELLADASVAAAPNTRTG